ncbi:PADI3 deiminase, partial [Crypturellus undulatus]|nr:PADI3 deiminase [Crypturellus undulatus]
MAQQRLVQLSAQHPTSTVCLLGTELAVDVAGAAPRGAASFHAQGTAGVKLYVVHEGGTTKLPSSVARWPLTAGVELLLAMEALSKDVGDEKVRISYFAEDGGVPLGRAMLYLTCVGGSTTGRDRMGAPQHPTALRSVSQRVWTWGPEGHGAVVLVNCDREKPEPARRGDEEANTRSYEGLAHPELVAPFPPDLKDMSQLVLRTRGPRAIFAGHRLVLHVSYSDADKLGVFYGGPGPSTEGYKHVLGGQKLSYAVKPSRHHEETIFYVEALSFPDAGFDGLLSLHVTLLDSAEKVPACGQPLHRQVPPCRSPTASPPQGLLETPIFTDTVVFRVAPWIMTPNTLAPAELYVCSVLNNQEFVVAVSALAQRAGCPVTVCPLVENRRDRWIQDEIEFGYVQAPHKTFPVVFDSPRDGHLKDFAVKHLLGPDFGYVAREAPEGTSSLDSFGNLEVSPPVTARGKEFPLGRILVGSSFPRFGGRRMAKAVRDFLVAQRVQAPVELFSDWLAVGHIDEFLTFVPAPDRQGFRLLLASPSACYRLLKEKQEEGYGEATMFEGLKWVTKRSVNEILADEKLRSFNAFAQVREGAGVGAGQGEAAPLDGLPPQSCINWNRDVLKRELGLAERDIVDVPQLFQSDGQARAHAFFPDMVNMLVLGRHLGIPKPFGPVIRGQCCLEEKVRSLLEPLGLSCTFIDDFFSYHALEGDVHCGTNVRRKPFAFKWWHMVP